MTRALKEATLAICTSSWKSQLFTLPLFLLSSQKMFQSQQSSQIFRVWHCANLTTLYIGIQHCRRHHLYGTVMQSWGNHVGLQTICAQLTKALTITRTSGTYLGGCEPSESCDPSPTNIQWGRYNQISSRLPGPFYPLCQQLSSFD